MVPSDIAGIISAIGNAEFPKALAGLLRNTAEIDTIVMLAYGRNQPPASLYDDCPADRRLRIVDSYISGAYKLDPFYLHCVSQTDPGLYRLKSLAPDHFSRSEYYRTYYKQIGIVDELGYFVKLEAETYAVISLGKYRSGGEFGKKALEDLIELEPIVRSAVARNWRLLPVRVPSVPDLSSDLLPQLTERERVIALMVLRGYSSEAIALNLGISRQTIKVHRRNIYAKLRISSATELFRLYLNGLGPTNREQLQR